jgi:hypothetical protein
MRNAFTKSFTKTETKEIEKLLKKEILEEERVAKIKYSLKLV